MSRLPIPLDNIFAGIGTLEVDYPVETKLKPQKPWEKVTSYALMLYWPKSESWLSLDVTAQASPTSPMIFFGDTREALEHTCRQHGYDQNRIAPPGFLNAANIRIGSVTQTTSVTINLKIDTSSESFRTTSLKQAGSGELVQKVSFRLFDTRSMNANFEQTGEINLILRPATPVPPFRGVVAIDLGNTSSDLACISRNNQVYRTSSIHLLDSEPSRPVLAENPSALNSAVRVDRITTFGDPPNGTRRYPDPMRPEDDLPKSVQFVAGKLAIGQTVAPMPGLILGAKRLVSGQAAEAFRRIVVQHNRLAEEREEDEEIEVQNKLPAELLACRLLENFRAAANAWPGELILTYPTTYTPRELDRLTQAVERGWLRMLGQAQILGGGTRPDDPELAWLVSDTQARLQVGSHNSELTPNGLIRHRIDEATAAAFFFLYKEIFESPGGLRRFRYLYPQGMNALLYDCGGGTTDIALVRASSDPLARNELKIEVLKRTGMRGFGGDDITRAVAKILKAKMLAELLRIRGKNVPAPTSANIDDQLISKLQEQDPNDLYVPTRFKRDRLDVDTLKRKRNALELFNWAEKLKIALSTLGPNGSVKFEGVLKGRDALAEGIYQGLTPQQEKAAEAQLKTIQLTRKTVDTYLDSAERGMGPVTKSVDKCNRLIQGQFRSGLQPEQEVHRVFVSGNAARYPLIREKLKELLEVDDLDERLKFDETNLKHSVAKGAALFWTTSRTPGLQATIRADADLSKRLPFDVGYFDLAKRKHILIYQENDQYESLEKADVKVEAESTGEANRSFTLERKFPGDEEFSQFIRYDFDRGVQGKTLQVSYNPETRDFEVKDSDGMPGTPVDLTDRDVYVAPAERGDV